MKIVHVVHSYYPKIGGIERAVQYLAEEQAKLGHEVYVITARSLTPQAPKEEEINKVKVIRIESTTLKYPDLTIPREIPQIDVNVIHAHSQNSLFALLLVERLKQRLNAKVAVHFMAVDTLRNHPNPLVRLLGSYYSKQNTLKAIKFSDLKLIRSLKDKEVLKKKYSINRVYYLPDAVPDYYFTIRKENPETFKKKFGIKQKNIFLFIGRIHKLKGSHILVQALKYINEEIAVVFIGPNGGYTKETLDLAERIGVRNKVYMFGYVGEEVKIHALDSAVALVLPSITDYVEVFPMVISEAWAREKPIIASKVGGTPYRIRDHVNGILVEPSSPESLAKAMSEILSNDELSRKMGQSGRENVLSWREVAMKSVKLYKRFFIQ